MALCRCLVLVVVLIHVTAGLVSTGADVLVSSQYEILQGRKVSSCATSDTKVGIIANPTTVLRNLTHLVDQMHADRNLINLVAIFGPEHGFRGDQQAGTGADTYIDNRTGGFQ